MTVGEGGSTRRGSGIRGASPMEPDAREALRALAHFRTLPPDLLDRLAAASRMRSFRAGEAIFARDDPARAFFLVHRGAVRVYRVGPDGHEQLVHYLREGMSFAEPAVLQLGRYPAWASAARTPTEVVEVAGETFRALLEEDRRFAAAIVGGLCRRMISLVERIEELSVTSAAARLARTLLALPARSSEGALEVALPMSKKDLAAKLAIAPETLSRLLRRWQDLGLLEVPARGNPRIVNLDGLLAIADRDRAQA